MINCDAEFIGQRSGLRRVASKERNSRAAFKQAEDDGARRAARADDRTTRSM